MHEGALVGVALVVIFAFLSSYTLEGMYDLSLIKNAFLVFLRRLYSELWILDRCCLV